MRVELDGLVLLYNGRPLRFGRSIDCELTLVTSDRAVPTLLGCVHYLDGEPSVTNLHRSVPFTVTASGRSRTVEADMSARLRHRRSQITVATTAGPVGFCVVLSEHDSRPPRAPRRLPGPSTWTQPATLMLRPDQLRDLAAVFEPTLRSGDFTLIRTNGWDRAGQLVGDSATNIKGRVLRTIAQSAQGAGCPKIEGLDGRQQLGRWLIDQGILTSETLDLLG